MSLNVGGTDDRGLSSAGTTFFDVSPHTIEVFVKPNGTATYNVTDHTGGGTVTFQTALVTNNNVRHLVYDTGANSTGVTGTFNILAGTWTRISVVWNGTAASVYINGTLDTAGTSGTRTIATDNSAVGVGRRGGGAAGFSIDGKLSDWRFWNTARAGTAMAADWNQRLTGGESGLACYLKLDEASGTVATDSTTGGHNFTQGISSWDTGDDPTFVGGGAFFGYKNLTGVGI